MNAVKYCVHRQTLFVGAKQNNIHMVGMTVGWMIVQLVLTTIFRIRAFSRLDDEFDTYDASNPIFDALLDAMITVLFVYPHIGFIHHVKSGILPRDA